MTKPNQKDLQALILSLVAVLGACSAPESTVDGAGPLPEPKRTFFVSRQSTGGDGTSWDRAWNELNRINWDVIEPGDRIVIDGGAQSMTYETALEVKKSGEEGAPIQIHAATEAGRNGQVIINGGRDFPLPFCQQIGYRQSEGPTRTLGINLQDAKWIHLDGGRWAGIRVHAFDGPGLQTSLGTEHITVRHLEVDDNGVPDWKDDARWYPSGAGLVVAGRRLLLERLIVHDNGGDAILTLDGIANLVVRGSWLHNRRAHPTVAGEPFNLCSRGNGVHIAGGGEQFGLTVQDSIVGPGFANGLLLGDARSAGFFGIVHDVILSNSLLVSHHGPSAVSNVSATLPARHPPQRWRIENVTSVRPPSAAFTNIALAGTGHIIQGSVLYGAQQNLVQEPKASGNCQWGTVEGVTLGESLQPVFADADFPGSGVGFDSFDFTLTEGSACRGAGSKITSVAGLLGQPDPSAPIPADGQQGVPLPASPGADNGGGTGAAPDLGNGTGTGTGTGTRQNARPSVSFVLPLEGAQYPPGMLTFVATATDTDGRITKVEFFVEGSSIGAATTEPYSVSWQATVGDHTLMVRATDDRGEVAELTRLVVVR